MIARRLYVFLEERLPAGLKRLIPRRWRIWLGYQVKVAWRHRAQSAPRVQAAPADEQVRPEEVAPPLTLPAGETRDSLRAYLGQFYVKEDGPGDERGLYLNEAFGRFLYTLSIVPEQSGRLLEIGAAPYFMSMLLRRFRSYDLTLMNYFDENWGDRGAQTLVARDGTETRLEFDHWNVEASPSPYPPGAFDVVLFCEVLEHLTRDPLAALLELKRVLKPQGLLILTTPNAVRTENVVRCLAGESISDSYSAYGPYGRHNREYTLDELRQLLKHAGFTIEESFTADVHAHPSYLTLPRSVWESLMQRRPTLGQYMFVRAINSHSARPGKPRWLYRSYPEDQLA